MATKIKETPVLRGKDAKRFLADISNPVPVSDEEMKRIRDTYEKFNAISWMNRDRKSDKPASTSLTSGI